MKLIIISGATRPQAKSNTAAVIAAFVKGLNEKGVETEAFYLADRKQWQAAKDAFAANENILFALPLYVENIPGIMLEFLTELQPKAQAGTRIGFIVQGGFPEAAQLRCCERYLETLPAKFNATYVGALLKGDMFGLRMMGDEMEKRLLEPYTEMGRRYAETWSFPKEDADAFAGPEHLPESTLRRFNSLGKHMQKFFMNRIARKLGCKKKLNDRPYPCE